VNGQSAYVLIVSSVSTFFTGLFIRGHWENLRVSSTWKYPSREVCGKYLYLEAELQDWEHYMGKSLLICILHLVLWKVFNLQPAKFHIRHDHNLQTGYENFRSRQFHTGESVIVRKYTKQKLSLLPSNLNLLCCSTVLTLNQLRDHIPVLILYVKQVVKLKILGFMLCVCAHCSSGMLRGVGW
jgi:hypothetical protein